MSLQKLSFIEKFTLASNVNTSPEVLTQLAEDNNDNVRERISSNPNTPPKVLTKLSEEVLWKIKSRVANNPSTPSEVLRKLSGSYFFMVKESVAGNPNTPENVLNELFVSTTGTDKNSTHTLRKLASNPNTPIHILIELSNRSKVQKFLFQNPTYLQYCAVRDGLCEEGVRLPVEWLEQLYGVDE